MRRRQIEQQHHESIVARLSGARSGILYDGMTDPLVANRVMEVIRRGGTTAFRSGTLHIQSGRRAERRVPGGRRATARARAARGTEQFERAGRRQVPAESVSPAQPGENPDIEVGRALGAHANQARVPALLAWAEYQAEGALPTSIAMVQQQVPSRGSEWQRALDEVRTYCEAAVLLPRTRAANVTPPSESEIEDTMGAYRATIELLGRRTADLHRTMAGIERDGFGVHEYGRDDLERRRARRETPRRARPRNRTPPARNALARGDPSSSID